jgi:hypothetical protein
MNMSNIDSNYFSTSDLPLAATISLWYPLDSIDANRQDKVNFLFKRDKGIDELVENYWRRNLRVDPIDIFNALKLLKSRIYGAK